MGNVRSVFLCRDAEVDWDHYVAAGWRSERARDLDKLGGLDRPAIKRGDSMTAKLGYLQASLKKQGQDIEKALNKNAHQRPGKKQEAAKYMLRTDVRALERAGLPPQDFIPGDTEDEPQEAELSWAEQQERERLAKLASRKKMLDYARSIKDRANSDEKQAPPGQSRVVAREAATNNVDATVNVANRQVARVSPGEDAMCSNLGRNIAVWRLRIHTARRRAIMVVLTIVRLRRGLNHPRRMQRVDSFSFYIPLALGEEYGRFVDEQIRYLEISSEMQFCQEAMEDILKKVMHKSTCTASSIHTTHGVHELPDIQQHQHQQHHLAASAPSRQASVRLPRMISRRANSDTSTLPALPSNDRLGITLGDNHLRSLSARHSAYSAHEQANAINAVGVREPVASGPSLTTLVEEQAELDLILDPGSQSLPAPRRARASEGSMAGARWHSGGNGRVSRDSTESALTPLRAGRPARRTDGSIGGSSSQQPAPSAAWLDRSSPSGKLPKLSNGGALPEITETVAACISDVAPAGRQGADSLENSSDFTFPAAVEQDGASASAWIKLPGDGSNQEQQHQHLPGQVHTLGNQEVANSGLPSHGRPTKPHRQETYPSASNKAALADHSSRNRANSESGTLPHQKQQPSFSGLRYLSHDGESSSSGDASTEAAAAAAVLSQTDPGQRPGPAARQQDTSPTRLHQGREIPASGLHTTSSGMPALSDGVRAEGANSRKLRSSVSGSIASEAAKIPMLSQRMDEEAARLQRCELMLGMYINRANAAWAERQRERGWSPGYALGPAEQQQFTAGEDFHIYRADLVRKLRTGQIVFQIFAAEDELPLPGGGGSLDLWTADAWELVASVRPGSMPISGSRLQGLPLGGRALTQLRTAVHAIAGHEAVAALTVVLHLHEGQREAAIADLVNRGLYGLRRENLLITVQQRRPGYRYDMSQRHFSSLDESGSPGKPHSLGPGYAMMQLSWVGDAFWLDASGGCVPLQGTLLEHLLARGAEWLFGRRSCDLALYSGDAAVDVAALAHVLQLREKARATLVTQVMHTTNVSTMRQMDSLVLSQRPLSGLLPFKRPADPPACVELRCCEVASTAMVDVLGQFRTEAAGELMVGMHRYFFHLPSLTSLLADINVFRPKLLLDGTAVHIALEISDLTAAPKARCIAVQAQDSCKMLLSSTEIEDLVCLLQVQDRDARFRKAAGSGQVSTAAITNVQTPVLTDTLSRAPNKPIGQRIVVFCAANDVTQKAIDFVQFFARAGRDEVFLVTVVPTTMQQEQGNQLVTSHFRQLAAVMIQPRMDVVVKGHAGLLECLETYVAASEASLVVMGSQAITTQTVITGSSSVAASVGSVAISCIKRLRLPIVVVTANTRVMHVEGHNRQARRKAAAAAAPGHNRQVMQLQQQQAADQKLQMPRVMAVVEGHARAMLQFLCSSCLDPLRGDMLFLGQVFHTRMLTTQQQLSAKRLMEAFADVAAGHHLPPLKMQLDGAFDKALQASAESEGLHLLALQLRPGEKRLPAQVLNLIRSSKAAVMIYKDRVAH